MKKSNQFISGLFAATKRAPPEGEHMVSIAEDYSLSLKVLTPKRNIKTMTVECPFCFMDNAYCDGVEYICPDCGRTWPCDEIPNDDWEY